jgi:antitoxin (DNA-binding transcriptional repressor) of toxin-antitoxin stability system
MIYEDTLTEYERLDKMKTIEVTNSTSLQDLVTLANQESEVVLTQDNKPVAKVLPIVSIQKAPDGAPPRRKLGLHRGAWKVGHDFDEPLPDEFWLGEK